MKFANDYSFDNKERFRFKGSIHTQKYWHRKEEEEEGKKWMEQEKKMNKKKKEEGGGGGGEEGEMNGTGKSVE